MKVLDCTIRDGGYYTDWDFDYSLVENYVRAMAALSPIEYIEIGYVSKEKEGYLGQYFYTPLELIEKFKKIAPEKKFALMVNAKDCDEGDLSKLLSSYRKTVDLIRIAVAPDKISSGIALAKEIKKLGFQAALNVMQISKVDERHEIYDLLSEIEQNVDFFYLVDSYGSVFPDQLKHLIESIKQSTNVKLGFHGHNNLELAFANTLTAIACGVEMVDGTILGMGRGAGNLKTELILSYLQKQEGGDFDSSQLSEVLSEFEKLREKYHWGTNFAYMTSGLYSLAQRDVMELINKRRYSINSVVLAMNHQRKQQKEEKQLKTLEELVQKQKDHSCKKVVIVGGGESVVQHQEAIKKLIEQDDIAVIHSSTRNLNTFEEVKKQQLLCLSGNEGYKINYSVNGNVKKMIQGFVLPPRPRKMGTYIPSDLEKDTYELSRINFTDEYQDSPLTISLQLALGLKAEEILLVGFDGYDSDEDRPLTNETQRILDAFTNENKNIYSITPTKYHNIKERSVYSLLTS